MQNNLDKLKDIKDIVPVEDYSMFILIGIIFSTFLLIFIVTYFLKKDNIRRKPTKKELAFKELKKLDLEKDDTKKIVYTITLNGALFLDEKNQNLYENIVQNSKDYKYKKDIQKLDNKTKKMIKEFIKTIKVGKKDGK